MEPIVTVPFKKEVLAELTEHVRHVRKCFDWPGIPPHDADQPEENRFNRFQWHGLPALRKLHHSPRFILEMSELFGVDLKPSYVFLSMYGPDGICPLHVDRPQCQYTVDLQIESYGEWPIYIDEKPYSLHDGEAILYSGTGQPHYRKSAREEKRPDNNAFFMNLAFFHFVPTSWMGKLE